MKITDEIERLTREVCLAVDGLGLPHIYGKAARLLALLDEREGTDPFRLSETIDKALGVLTRSPAQNKKRKYTVLDQKFASPRGGEYNPTRPQPPLHG